MHDNARIGVSDVYRTDARKDKERPSSRHRQLPLKLLQKARDVSAEFFDVVAPLLNDHRGKFQRGNSSRRCEQSGLANLKAADQGDGIILHEVETGRQNQIGRREQNDGFQSLIERGQKLFFGGAVGQRPVVVMSRSRSFTSLNRSPPEKWIVEVWVRMNRTTHTDRNRKSPVFRFRGDSRCPRWQSVRASPAATLGRQSRHCSSSRIRRKDPEPRDVPVAGTGRNSSWRRGAQFRRTSTRTGHSNRPRPTFLRGSGRR